MVTISTGNSYKTTIRERKSTLRKKSSVLPALLRNPVRNKCMLFEGNCRGDCLCLDSSNVHAYNWKVLGKNIRNS